MNKSRRRFSAEFKAKVALEAIREQLTLSELSEKYSLHATQISQWKQAPRTSAHQSFQVPGCQVQAQSPDTKKDPVNLQTIIGRQQVELDFLKKSLEKLQG